jgi:hypothetical protein
VGSLQGGRARSFWLFRAPRPNHHSCPRAPVPERTSIFRDHEVGWNTLLRLGQNRSEIGYMVSTRRTDIHPPPVTAAWLVQSAGALLCAIS